MQTLVSQVHFAAALRSQFVVAAALPFPSHAQQIIRVHDTENKHCAYRLCRPNVVPMETDHDMVEALASDRADQPFDMPVLPR